MLSITYNLSKFEFKIKKTISRLNLIVSLIKFKLTGGILFNDMHSQFDI